MPGLIMSGCDDVLAHSTGGRPSLVRMSEMKRTPLRDFHAANGARLVDFAGWEMPVQYRSILEKHKAVRRSTGLFDVSHMGEVDVKGPDALRYLNHLVTNDVAKLVIAEPISLNFFSVLVK